LLEALEMAHNRLAVRSYEQVAVFVINRTTLPTTAAPESKPPPAQAKGAGGAVVSVKVAAAIDAFENACNKRMADANAANEPKEPLFHYTREPIVPISA
jgi:hypothetical protein